MLARRGSIKSKFSTIPNVDVPATDDCHQYNMAGSILILGTWTVSRILKPYLFRLIKGCNISLNNREVLKRLLLFIYLRIQ